MLKRVNAVSLKTRVFEKLNSIVFYEFRVDSSNEVDWFTDEYSIESITQKFRLASVYQSI